MTVLGGLTKAIIVNKTNFVLSQIKDGWLNIALHCGTLVRLDKTLDDIGLIFRLGKVISRNAIGYSSVLYNVV